MLNLYMDYEKIKTKYSFIIIALFFGLRNSLSFAGEWIKKTTIIEATDYSSSQARQ